jgi:hypothetical protein
MVADSDLRVHRLQHFRDRLLEDLRLLIIHLSGMGLRDVLRETARGMEFLGFVLSGNALVEFGMCIVSVLLLHYMFCNTTSRSGDTECNETLYEVTLPAMT